MEVLISIPDYLEDCFEYIPNTALPEVLSGIVCKELQRQLDYSEKPVAQGTTKISDELLDKLVVKLKEAGLSQAIQASPNEEPVEPNREFIVESIASLDLSEDEDLGDLASLMK